MTMNDLTAYQKRRFAAANHKCAACKGVIRDSDEFRMDKYKVGKRTYYLFFHDSLTRCHEEEKLIEGGFYL